MNSFFISKSRSFNSIIFFVVCFLTVVCFSVLAETTTSTTSPTPPLDKTDIVQTGMNMFTTAYKWETGNYSGYQSDAFIGFTKKLNLSISNKKNGIPRLVEMCGGCSDIVQDGFDTALMDYLRDTPPELTNGIGAYYSVLAPYLHKKIPRYILRADTLNDLNDRVKSMVNEIKGQVREQMDSFRDVSGMGLYYDGDTDNSSYDLLDDIRKIDEVFFRESPAFGKYKNTSQEDASALITGQARQGSWVGGGESYNIDLTSDIKKALGGGDSDENISDTGSSNSNEAAGDCSSGYCVTVDFIQSTHNLLGGSGSSSSNTSLGGKKGDQSLQGIIEEALDWIVRNGDKRNFACKKPPTFFFFQTNNTSNYKLRDSFSGPSMYMIKALPTLLKKDKDKTNTNGANQQSKEEKETNDIIRARFTAKGLDYDKPTNIKGSLKAGTMYSGLSNAYRGVQNANDVVESVDRTNEYYNQVLTANGAQSNRSMIHEYSKESIEHLEKTFEEMASRAKLLREFSDDLNKILTELSKKGYCSN